MSEILERGMDVVFIMIPDDHAAAASGAPDIIGCCIDSPDITVCEVPAREFARLTDAVSGIGMLAVVRMPETGADIIDGLSPDANVLVLDRIQDPGNMGTLIRTAVASGYGAVIAMSGTVDIYSPKVLRSTAGMVFGIPLIYLNGYDELEDMLRRSGRRIAVTVPSGGEIYYRADLNKGIALVIGNEGRGISSEIAGMADIRVTLPMKGSVESLNAAVAAAILMYESMRD